jgi:aspartyl aminopeptidase
MVHILEDLKAFLDASPTSYHATSQIGNRLALKEFIPLDEEESWQVEKGGRYFVTRDGALCAFIIPSSSVKQIILLGSHTDSPALKLKPRPEHRKENLRLLGVEIYGGPLISSWLNRDLSLAGRVVVTDGSDKRVEKLIWIDDAPLCIPQLAIHLDREVNDKGLLLNKQDHLIPLAGLIKDNATFGSYLETLLRRHIQFKNLLAFDLFLTPLEPARFLGMDGELLSSYRLDNLSSCHACVTAMGLLEETPSAHTLQMAIFWDHEEIGSKTREGAASSFLCDTLKRLRLAMRIEEEAFLKMKGRSSVISIDVAHAFHPAYEKKFDPQHLPLLGEGIVLKYNADHRYTTDAITASYITQAMHALNLKYQSYVCRNDLTSGSTIGPVVETQLGIPCVDIGLPLLSMHSIREVIACKDHLDLCALLHHLLLGDEV